jgi:hypothetical protein
MAALAILALELRDRSADWWVTLTLVGAFIAAPLLALAAMPLMRASRLRPQVAGQAGDVFDDIGLGRTGPLRFALLVSIGLGLVVFLSAAAQGDPFDGALNAAGEAVACLSGFALFGRYLGLRH